MKFSKVLFILGVLMVCAGMVTMRMFHYLIPAIIGCLGIMAMAVSMEVEECRDM